MDRSNSSNYINSPDERRTNRYERKFLVPDLSKQDTITIIKQHPAFFLEVYMPRQINNIYLDTRSFESYFDNKNGYAERKKVRIRWYGDTKGQINNPMLEVKYKTGFLVDKQLFPIESFFLDNGFYPQLLKTIISKSKLPPYIRESLEDFRPALLNSYQRTYFQTIDNKYRLTLDNDLVYYNISMSQNASHYQYLNPIKVILEIKYDQDEDQNVNNITNWFHFRLDKNSKYAKGIDLIFNYLAF